MEASAKMRRCEEDATSRDAAEILMARSGDRCGSALSKSFPLLEQTPMPMARNWQLPTFDQEIMQARPGAPLEGVSPARLPALA
jgi:hypothetical protein